MRKRDLEEALRIALTERDNYRAVVKMVVDNAERVDLPRDIYAVQISGSYLHALRDVVNDDAGSDEAIPSNAAISPPPLRQ